MTLIRLRPVEVYTRPAFFRLAFGNLKRACYAVNLSPERRLTSQGANSPMISRKILIALAIAMLSVTTLWAGQWTALGPDGGDVRSLGFDPQNPDRIYLGTSTERFSCLPTGDTTGLVWPIWVTTTTCLITSRLILRTRNTFTFLPGA